MSLDSDLSDPAEWPGNSWLPHLHMCSQNKANAKNKDKETSCKNHFIYFKLTFSITDELNVEIIPTFSILKEI